MRISTQTFTPDTCIVSAVDTMNRVPLTSDSGINTVGAADTGFSPVAALVAGTALCALGATAVVIATGSAPISGPLAAAGGAAMGFGVSKLPS